MYWIVFLCRGISLSSSWPDAVARLTPGVKIVYREDGIEGYYPG